MFDSLYHFSYRCFLNVNILHMILFFFVESKRSKINGQKVIITWSYTKLRQGKRSYKYVQFEIVQRQNGRARNKIHRFLTVLHTPKCKYNFINVIVEFDSPTHWLPVYD